MADQYGVWDTQSKSWVRNKQYDSVSKANAASNRLDKTYGGSRYVPKVMPGSLPESPAKTSSADTEQDTVAAKRGGYVKSADGLAQRGKTRGKIK